MTGLTGRGSVEEKVASMAIAVITDSAADLPQALVDEYGIEVVPLEVHLGAETFRDGVDLGTEEFFSRVIAGNLAPKTSQPPLGTFVEVYRRVLTRFQSIIAIHLAGNLSGTYATAELAARSFPSADITVVDSCSVSLGLGLQVIRAARAIRDGLSKENVLRLVEEGKKKAQVLVCLNTLEFLERGGRIGKVTAFLGSLLHLKPLVRVADGQVLPLARSRSRSKAIEDLLANLAPYTERGRVLLGVMHTTAAKEAEELRRRVQDLFGRVEVLVEAGPVLGAHAGPDALAVAIVPE